MKDKRRKEFFSESKCLRACDYLYSNLIVCSDCTIHSASIMMSDQNIFQLNPQPTESYISLQRVEGDEWSFEFTRIGENEFQTLGDITEAYKLGIVDDALQAAQALVETYPEFLDARYVLLNLLLNKEEHERAFEFLLESMSLAMQCIPPEFQFNVDTIPYYYEDNQAFLMMQAHCGGLMVEAGMIEEAIEFLKMHLSINPDDDLGTRTTLLNAYFLKGAPEKILELAGDFPDEDLWAMLYGVSLAQFQLGKKEAAEKNFRRAVKMFPLAAAELIKRGHPETIIPVDILNEPSDADLALDYWYQFGTFWESTPGAIAWVQQMLGKQKLRLK